MFIVDALSLTPSSLSFTHTLSLSHTHTHKHTRSHYHHCPIQHGITTAYFVQAAITTLALTPDGVMCTLTLMNPSTTYSIAQVTERNSFPRQAINIDSLDR